MADALIVLNTGSSSVKFALYRVGDAGPVERFRGQIETKHGHAHLRVAGSRGAVVEDRTLDEPVTDRPALIAALLRWCDEAGGGDRLIAAGHRIVHGGMEFIGPALIDAAVLQGLRALIPLAPLHQPNGIAGIEAIAALHPGLPQVASFDTAFHRDLPAVTTRIALPAAYAARGVRRYGFHGLSYAYIASVMGDAAPDIGAEARVVVAHLGNGASLCAMRGGASVDTTMGFTPLDGLVMGTRCGAIDPGVLLYLLREDGLDAAALEDLLWHRSGLLGVSGVSADTRDLLESDAPAARDAIDLFVFRIVREIGAMAASLGGIDALVFTGGIGENQPAIRAAICHACRWLGIEIDEAANRVNGHRIGAVDAPTGVWVIPTDEEAVVARETAAVLGFE